LDFFNIESFTDQDRCGCDGALVSLLWNQVAVLVNERNHDSLFVAGLYRFIWLDRCNIVVAFDDQIGFLRDLFTDPFNKSAVSFA